MASRADDTTVSTIRNEIEDISREHFATPPSGELHPEGGFRFSPPFDVSSDIADRLCVAYGSDMEELHYGQASLPTWQEICQRIASRSV